MGAFDFQIKSFVIWEQSVLKSRFLLNNISDTAAWNTGMFFSILIALPLLDHGAHPEGLGILCGQQIAKCIMLGGLDGSDFNEMWSN